MVDKIEKKEGEKKNIHPVSIVAIQSRVSYGIYQRAKGSELSLSRNIFVEILIREGGSVMRAKSYGGSCNAARI